MTRGSGLLDVAWPGLHWVCSSIQEIPRQFLSRHCDWHSRGVGRQETLTSQRRAKHGRRVATTMVRLAAEGGDLY